METLENRHITKMKTVNTLLKQLQSIDTNEVIIEALIETEQEYVKKNKEQMLTGFNSEGNRIGQYANPVYKAKKMIQNPLASGYVDLKKEGDFQGAMFATTDNVGLRVGSQDSKTNILQEKYGEEIFTLSPLKKNEYIKENLRPATIIRVINRLK